MTALDLTPQDIHRLDAWIQQHMANHATPGLSLAITDRQELIHLAAYGCADLAAGTPVSPGTLFEIGSISKSFTAIALLQLHEKGLIDPQAPVTEYLPWFSVRSDHPPITLHHLLSHSAGIIRGTDFSTEATYEVWALRNTAAAAPPGACFHYSNVGYKALGLVLEAVLELPYGAIIRQKILDPLNMANTDPVITHATRLKLAVGYEPLFDDRPFYPDLPLRPATWLELDTGDGSIAAPASDMAIYLRALLNRGRGLISERSFQLLTRPVIPFSESDGPPRAAYACGLIVSQDQGHTILEHSGGMVGYYADVRLDMDLGLGVVVLTNGPGEPDQISQAVLQHLRALTDPEIRPPEPPRPPTAPVEGAADYVGRYQGPENREFILQVVNERLVMAYAGQEIPLLRRKPDNFAVPHPDFQRFLLRFERQEGRPVLAFHGPDCYAVQGQPPPPVPDYPAHWHAFTGHYRSHNPWLTNFRIGLRQGRLHLFLPDGSEDPDAKLTPLGQDSFCVGDPDHSPERLSFDTMLAGKARRANLSGEDYYRTFTP